MEDTDIKKLRQILAYKGQETLSQLLSNCTSNLNESSTFGSRWYSRLSSFEISFPMEKAAQIDALKKKEKEEILKALHIIYPIKDDSPEITGIEFFPKFEEESTRLVEAKSLDRISFEYIQEQVAKCNAKIAEKDFEGSITNARNLIESICLFIVESKTKENVAYDGNLIKLYKQVASLLKMSPGDYDDDNLKQILSGVFSIINGVSGVRNNYSDSHGSSPSGKQYKIDDRHAILCVNLAKTITEYLFLSFEKSEIK